MRKIMMVIVMCLMLVGCSKQTALDITKENYKEFGYNYADVELKKMISDRENGKNNYEYSDLGEALGFLTSVQFGVDVNDESEKIINDSN